MDTLTNFNQDLSEIDVNAISRQTFTLTPQQQVWIDYKALGGIIYDHDAHEHRKMGIDELAEALQVTPPTLYNWRDAIPDFWDRVAQRRKELNAGEWLAKLHETWKIKAATFKDWRVTEAWLINFDETYKAPKLKVEHEIGDSLAEAMKLAQSRRVKAIEGEVVDNAPND